MDITPIAASVSAVAACVAAGFGGLTFFTRQKPIPVTWSIEFLVAGSSVAASDYILVNEGRRTALNVSIQSVDYKGMCSEEPEIGPDGHMLFRGHKGSIMDTGLVEISWDESRPFRKQQHYSVTRPLPTAPQRNR